MRLPESGWRARGRTFLITGPREKSTRELGETERGFISGCHRVPGIQMTGQTARDDDEEEDGDDAERVFFDNKNSVSVWKWSSDSVWSPTAAQSCIDRACYHTEEWMKHIAADGKYNRVQWGH